MRVGARMHIGLSLLGMLCPAATAICATPADVHALEARVQQLEAALQRTSDVQAIEALMARRAYLHSNGQNDREFELFAHRDDVSFATNQGYWVGPAFKASYVDYHAAQQKRDLAWARKLNPAIADSPDNIGVGGFVMHTLTTPLIVVADDRQTAKGMWYTPGALAGVDGDGQFKGHWMWEKYAVDFIRENGHWKFWHVLVATDFGVEMGQPLGQSAAVQSNANSSVETSGVPKLERPPMPAPSYPNDRYHEWAATVVHDGDFPRMPEPYRTFSETFSYGPSGH